MLPLGCFLKKGEKKEWEKMWLKRKGEYWIHLIDVPSPKHLSISKHTLGACLMIFQRLSSQITLQSQVTRWELPAVLVLNHCTGSQSSCAWGGLRWTSLEWLCQLTAALSLSPCQADSDFKWVVSFEGMDIYKDKLCHGHIHIASPSAQHPGKPEPYPVNSWLYGMQEAGKRDT